jgi:hypothetical protein
MKKSLILIPLMVALVACEETDKKESPVDTIPEVPLNTETIQHLKSLPASEPHLTIESISVDLNVDINTSLSPINLDAYGDYDVIYTAEKTQPLLLKMTSEFNSVAMFIEPREDALLNSDVEHVNRMLGNEDDTSEILILFNVIAGEEYVITAEGTDHRSAFELSLLEANRESLHLNEHEVYVQTIEDTMTTCDDGFIYGGGDYINTDHFKLNLQTQTFEYRGVTYNSPTNKLSYTTVNSYDSEHEISYESNVTINVTDGTVTGSVIGTEIDSDLNGNVIKRCEITGVITGQVIL